MRQWPGGRPLDGFMYAWLVQLWCCSLVKACLVWAGIEAAKNLTRPSHGAPWISFLLRAWQRRLFCIFCARTLVASAQTSPAALCLCHRLPLQCNNSQSALRFSVKYVSSLTGRSVLSGCSDAYFHRIPAAVVGCNRTKNVTTQQRRRYVNLSTSHHQSSWQWCRVDKA